MKDKRSGLIKDFFSKSSLIYSDTFFFFQVQMTKSNRCLTLGNSKFRTKIYVTEVIKVIILSIILSELSIITTCGD